MRSMLLRLASQLALGFALVVGAVPAFAAGEFVTKARNAILIDYASGAVLYQKSADDLVPPASTSKLVTLAVLFRALKEGRIKLDDEFKTSENAWRTGGAPSGSAAMFIPINTSTSIRLLIQGIAVQSGNDAAITVAEGLSGSVPEFAKEMEKEARRIGLKKSTFRNSTGLHHPEHLMTARELAMLARYIIKEYPEQYAVFSQKEFQYRTHKFYNRNPLLGANLGVDGLKTGHTKEAGFSVVLSSLAPDGRRLIGVLMGFDDEKDRRADATQMITWGLTSVSKVKLFDAGTQIGFARVWGGASYYVPLEGQGGLEVVLPSYPANQRLRGEIVYQGPLKPPIKKGDQVAMFRVTSLVPNSSEPIATSETPLFAAADVEPSGIAWRGVDSLLHLLTGWIPL